jgi:lipopolysaccharide biosynthesis glycosyltransferase
MATGDIDTIHIVTACDDAYAQHAHVFLASMLFSNPEHKFRVYILVPTGFRFADRLRQLEQSGTCEIHFVESKSELVADFSVSGHVSTATYLRLLIGDVIPAEVERIIYFDSDIIIQGDLLPLWQQDLGDHLIGAVTSAPVGFKADVKRKLGLGNNAKYFNAGVMLIDLVRWRAADVSAAALRVCREQREVLTYHDQCALNYVLAGRVKELSVIWNMQTGHLGPHESPDASHPLLREARVVHFTASFKPWHYRCRHPLAGTYWRFLADTPWRGYVPPDRTMLNMIKRPLTRVLPASVVQRARALLHGT